MMLKTTVEMDERTIKFTDASDFTGQIIKQQMTWKDQQTQAWLIKCGWLPPEVLDGWALHKEKATGQVTLTAPTGGIVAATLGPRPDKTGSLYLLLDAMWRARNPEQPEGV